MSYLKKVEIIALKKKHSKTVKSKSAKAAEPKNPDLKAAKKVVSSFFKFMESFIDVPDEAKIEAATFLAAMNAVWKAQNNRQAKTYTAAEFPAVIDLLKQVQKEAQK